MKDIARHNKATPEAFWALGSCRDEESPSDSCTLRFRSIVTLNMAADGGHTCVRVKVCGKEEVLSMTVDTHSDRMEDLARQVSLPTCCCALQTLYIL